MQLASKPKQDALQPFSVRFFIFLNVLFWNVQIPYSELTLHLHVLLTILFGLIAGLNGSIVSIRSLLFIFAFVLYSTVSYLTGPCMDNEVKVFTSITALVLIMVSLRRLARAVRWDHPLMSVNQVYTILCLAALSAVIDFVFNFLSGTPLADLRVGGLYQEPSHLALSISPLIFLLWFSGSRLWAVFFTFLFVFTAFSSTLIVMLLILVGIPYMGKVLSRRAKPADILTISILITTASFVLFTGSETFLRITDLVNLSEDSNLSSLVYANGWQQFYHYLISTSGIGLGANAMGCSPIAETPITYWLQLMGLADQNFNDGSFLFSKLGSEFGLVGILLFAALLVYTIHGLFRVSINSSSSEIILFAWLAVISFGGLVRSAGYFTGPVMMAIFAFFAIEICRDRGRKLRI